RTGWPGETLLSRHAPGSPGFENDPQGTHQFVERHTSPGRKAHMTDRKSNPPRQAIWLLQQVCPGDNEALTGDLIERFREGQSRAWFWKQVLIAVAVGVLGAIRLHWPQFCYAIAGVVLSSFWDAPAIRSLPGPHWSDLPWPWSQLAFELSRPVLLALAALSIL